MFVGYQAENSLGYKVKNGEKEITLSNTGEESDRVKVNMEVYNMNGGFSGHSDLSLTKKWVSKLTSKPNKIILNHGNPKTIYFFSKALLNMENGFKILTPENLESCRLN